MAAKDIFHAAVRQALIKEQWVITADPLVIKINKVKLEIDLAAEKIFAAEKAGRKIAVEVKSFVSSSVIFDFHLALGQFLNYRLALQMKEPDRIIYLAVPLDTFNSFFQEIFVQAAVKLYQLKLVIYDANKEEIVEWRE
ncbi:XisH family protein [Brasilonema sp. CT11]|nr:XisH family protein [Brasilonema sp. CT11]